MVYGFARVLSFTVAPRQDGGSAVARAFDQMIDMLRVHNTEARLCCVLHMLTETLHTFPHLPNESLHRLREALSAFYCWPFPFGPLVQRLDAIVQREIVVQGAALRDSFVRERPGLASLLQGSVEHPTALLYEVPVFVDPSEPNCCFLEMSLSLPPESSKQTLPPSPGSTTNDDAMLLLLDILRRAGWQVLELPLDATTLLQDLYKSNPDAVIVA
jgi:hypothetical protein